jgi:hypothetical protein
MTKVSKLAVAAILGFAIDIAVIGVHVVEWVKPAEASPMANVTDPAYSVRIATSQSEADDLGTQGYRSVSISYTTNTRGSWSYVILMEKRTR